MKLSISIENGFVSRNAFAIHSSRAAANLEAIEYDQITQELHAVPPAKKLAIYDVICCTIEAKMFLLRKQLEAKWKK